jgi:hypothetical protein
MSEIAEYLRCEKDICHFATKYCLTEKKLRSNALNSTIIEPFPDFPYLRELLLSLHGVGNTLDEKSRQMLWSWAAMIDSLHCLTFQKSYSEKVLSRKEELVDDGGMNSTTDSLFGRLRFMWNGLPAFLRQDLVFNSLRVVNQNTGSFVKGESTNKKATRGGTYSKVKADEWAFCDNSESIFSAIKSACPNNIKFGSTPNGKGNNFARLRFGDSNDTGFKTNTWHWRLNPEKTQAWYDNEIKGLTKEQVAREYEISYEGSVEGRVYYAFDFSKQVVDLEYNKDLPLFTAWDFGLGDPTSIIWLQVNPNGEIYVIDEYELNEEEAPHFAKIVTGKYSNKYEEHIGDPAGQARGVTKKSWISWLMELGVWIRTPSNHTIDERITATRRIIPRLYVSKKCTLFQDRIANYKFPTDDEGRPTGDKPIHNWASHMMTALEFFVTYKYPLNMGGYIVIPDEFRRGK